MIQCLARLIERRTYGAHQELRLEAPEIARQLGAGQPVLLSTGSGFASPLRRVLYPLAIDDSSWWMRIAPDGDWGHAWLRTLPIGSEVDCLGPVGHGFVLPETAHNLLFAGEDEAAWSLLPAIMKADAAGANVALAMQCRSARHAIPADRLPERVEYTIHVAGSEPPTSEIAPLIEWADALLAAASLSYYQFLIPILHERRFGLRRGFGQILYPATILCGIGACLACAADLTSGRRRICVRGPVLDLAELDAGG